MKVLQGNISTVLTILVTKERLEIFYEIGKDHCFPVEDLCQVQLRPGLICVVSHERDGKSNFSGVIRQAFRVGDGVEANLANKQLS